MLVDNYVTIKSHNRYKKYYESMGYVFDPETKEALIKIEDLQLGSNVFIRVYCDYCLEEGIETIINKQYYKYIKEREVISKDACLECKGKKREDCVETKYGVRCVFQIEDIKKKIEKTQINKYGMLYHKTEERKEKIRTTNIAKYGVENPIQNKEIMDKMKQTNIMKYGVENVFQNEEIKERYRENIKSKYGVENVSQIEGHKDKVKKTSQENWGTDNPSQSEIIKKKIQKTSVRRYGVKNFTQTKEYLIKTKKTNNKKYGVDWHGQSEEIKKKIKLTMNEKYGVDNAFQSEKIKNKIKKHYLDAYGVEYPMQVAWIKEKASRTLFKNGSCPVSKQQIEVYENLKHEGYNVELNYPVDTINVDVALFVDDMKIGIEYDAWYWHKTREQQDRRRDEHLKKIGWKILRIRSNRNIPDNNVLISSIQKLIDTGRTFTQIFMDDWGESSQSVRGESM